MSKKSQRTGWIPFSIWVFFLSSLSQAEISYLDLKGVHEWIKPEYQSYSPVYGYTLLGSETLRNLRFFGNYGPKNKDHGCMETVPRYRDGFNANGNRIPGLKERNDCPQDFTSEWIQRLFPSVDGQTIVENGADSDPVSHLKPETIGALLQRISKLDEKIPSSDGAAQNLESDFYEILMKDLFPAEYKKEALHKARLEELKLKSQISECTRDQDQKKQGLQQKLEELQDIIQKLEPDEGAAFRGRKKVSSNPQIGALAHLLVGALREARAKSHPDSQHWPEQALMAYFLKRSNTKEDILSLFRGMPELLTRQDILTDQATQNNFKSKHWMTTDRSRFNGDPKTVAAIFSRDPEALIFEVKERSKAASPIPPIISFKTNVPHSSLGGGVHGDCGEALVRNVMNFAVFNSETGQFDTKKLTALKAAHPELVFRPSLLYFYAQNSDPARAGSDPVHAEWNEKVLSRLSGVQYRQGGAPPVCDMDAGVDNLIRVMDQLLFDREAGQKVKMPGSLSDPALTTRAQRLNRLFALLSKEGSHLQWSMKGKDPNRHAESEQELNSKNLDVDIDIRLGDSAASALRQSPIMQLGFTAGHFSVTPLSNPKNTWKESILKALIAPGTHPKEVENQIADLLPLLIDSHTIDAIPKERQTPAHFHALSLKSASDQISAFKRVVSHSHAKAMAPLGKTLKRKLGTGDIGTLKEISLAESDAYYPFDGNTVHPIGKPEVAYTRVSPEVLAAKFTEKAARQMGRSWSRNMHGHQVAIGEPLLKADGTELKANVDDAKKACLDLNQPKEKRDVVEAAFNAREAALDAVRKDRTITDETVRAEKLKEIHRTMPIPGIYLMSKEEWKILEGDFGYQPTDSKYVPQILSKLSNLRFWSSSGHPNYPGSAFYVNGYSGGVFNDFRGSDKSVRCGAGAWVM